MEEEENSVQRAGECRRIADCRGRTAECGLQTVGWWSATVDRGLRDYIVASSGKGGIYRLQDRVKVVKGKVN